jgi:hypothetical protein
MSFLLLIGVILLGGLLHDTRKRLAAVEKVLKAQGQPIALKPDTPKTAVKPAITSWRIKPDPLSARSTTEPLAPAPEPVIDAPAPSPSHNRWTSPRNPKSRPRPFPSRTPRPIPHSPSLRLLLPNPAVRVPVSRISSGASCRSGPVASPC